RKAEGSGAEVVVEDRHLELIGGLAFVVVAEQNADELIADIHLGGILLARPLLHFKGRQPEHALQIALKLDDFVSRHSTSPSNSNVQALAAPARVVALADELGRS